MNCEEQQEIRALWRGTKVPAIFERGMFQWHVMRYSAFSDRQTTAEAPSFSESSAGPLGLLLWAWFRPVFSSADAFSRWDSQSPHWPPPSPAVWLNMEPGRRNANPETLAVHTKHSQIPSLEPPPPACAPLKLGDTRRGGFAMWGPALNWTPDVMRPSDLRPRSPGSHMVLVSVCHVLAKCATRLLLDQLNAPPVRRNPPPRRRELEWRGRSAKIDIGSTNICGFIGCEQKLVVFSQRVSPQSLNTSRQLGRKYFKCTMQLCQML